MQSSSGDHFIALDHIRALAAFLVCAWHFLHGRSGFPVQFNFGPAVFPLSLFDEGHTGVALFMCLSGYLFAKLLNGKALHYGRFIWNRALRLLPLLLVVIVLAGAKHVWSQSGPISEFLTPVALGFVHPTLPNGGWSITVEFHFYLVLPILLWLMYQSRWTLVALIALSTAIRIILYARYGEVQFYSYWTIAGRIDQFVLGMLAFNLRSFFSFRHALAMSIIAAFGAFYWFFDVSGGFYNMPTYPSPAALWIFMPTIEGAAYGSIIAWYDSSFFFKKTGLSRFVSQLGAYSYSIYLLHFFIVFRVSGLIHEYVMDISNFYIALLWSLAFYIFMMPIGYLSFRFVEAPFLRLRTPYTKPIKDAKPIKG